MMSVVILINGQPVMARSCRRIAKWKYRVDDGTLLQHAESEGAVKLAIKLLKTVRD